MKKKKAQLRWGWHAAAARIGIPFETYERHRLAGDWWCPRCGHWRPLATAFYLRTDRGRVVARTPCKLCRERERDAWRARKAGIIPERRTGERLGASHRSTVL